MALINRLSNVFRRRGVNDDIDEELQFHLESRIRDNIASGMSPDEARRDAQTRFGSRAAARNQAHDANVIVALESAGQDLAFAARAFRKRPIFALGAVITLALGIGANATILTVVRSVVLRPLPFPDSQNLCSISYSSPGQPFFIHPGLSDRAYLALRERDRSFESLTTFGSNPLTLTGAGDAVRVVAATVTPDFFRVLRVGPSLGTGFASDQDHPGRDHVAVIGDGLWRTRFGADESVLNRSITLNGTQYTVIGVMPAGFSYPSKTDLWIPLAVRADPHLTYSRPVIGRLAPGVSREQAGAAFEVFASNVLRDRGGAPDQIARVIALKDAMVGDVKQPLAIFSGAVIFVLLIACANVANLLLMRATTRRQEIATRMALGASRSRLVRQLLTESAALSIVGGLAALGVAAVTAPVLLTLVPEGMLPRASEIRADGWVLAVTMTGALIAGVLLGLAPALQATRGDVSNALREGPGSSTKRSLRFRHGLIVAEMALALVLLVGAGLLVKSFLKLRAVDPGFESSHVMTMTIELPDTRYASPAALKAFHQRLLESLSSLPDVTSAGLVNWIPLGTLVLRGDFEVEGLPAPGWNVMKAAVSAGYFRALGIRLLQGRDFTAEDSAGSQRVVIVNDSMARRIWPDGNAVGRRIAIDSPAKPDDWLTVIGVVADVRQGGLAHRAPPALYQPYEQVTHQFWLSHMTFVVRTTGDPASSAPRMRTALQTIDNEQAPHALATMEDLVAGTIAEPRFQSRLLGLFSLLALVLAGLGVYGVLASSVAERRREIGIRLALGAGRASVAGLIMRRTLTLASIGVVLGTIGGLAVTRVLAKLLFGVTPTDLTTFLGAASVLVAVAVASSLIPARHASTVDPLLSLKAE